MEGPPAAEVLAVASLALPLPTLPPLSDSGDGGSDGADDGEKNPAALAAVPPPQPLVLPLTPAANPLAARLLEECWRGACKALRETAAGATADRTAAAAAAVEKDVDAVAAVAVVGGSMASERIEECASGDERREDARR